MPQLIQTPEQWFRTKKSDIYYFKPTPKKSKANRKNKMLSTLRDLDRELPEELLNWFKAVLPHRQLELVGSSEYGGWVSGGGSYWAMELDEADVNKFVARWEDGNDKSIDPRFQCFGSPYSRWLEGVSRIQVFDGIPPPSEKAYRWVIGKAGTFWLKGDFSYEDKSKELEEKPYQQIRSDDLWRVQQIFSSIQLGVDEIFLAGGVNVRDGKQICIFEYFAFEVDDFTHPLIFFDEAKKSSFVRQITDALKLAQDAEIGEFWD
jgi:hypothetical protein